MIGIIGCTNVCYYDLRYITRALAASSSLLVVIDEPTSTSTPAFSGDELVCTDLCTVVISRACVAPPPHESHINGNLRYLYRPKALSHTPVVRRRHVIQQPCWSARRWKSKT